MYPNPYVRPGMLASLRNINWGGILDGTQKTLGVINQAIPIVYQVKPIFSNMRSLFRIANEINAPDTPSQKSNVSQSNTVFSTSSNANSSTNNSSNKNYTTNPIFYI